MIALRPLEIGDIEVLQEIDRDAHGEAWSQAAFQDQIQSAAFRHLVAVAGDDPVGHAGVWLDQSTLRLTNLAVAAPARSTGVGRALLLELLRDTHGCVRSQLEVRPANTAAQRLYGQFGYAPVAVDRDFYERRDERGSRDAVVMTIDDLTTPEWLARIDTISRTQSPGAAA